MERKIKTLNILFIIYMIIGVCATAYVGFVASIMSGLTMGVIISSIVSLFVIFPYYAKRALAKNNVIPSVCHSVFIMLFATILLPLAIWELVLAIQVRKQFEIENA